MRYGTAISWHVATYPLSTRQESKTPATILQYYQGVGGMSLGCVRFSNGVLPTRTSEATMSSLETSPPDGTRKNIWKDPLEIWVCNLI